MIQRVLLACVLCWGVLAVGVEPDPAHASAPEQPADSAGAKVPSRVTIPLRLKMSEGGVRIRSVHGVQPLIIIRTPPGYGTPAPYAGSAAAPAAPALPATTGVTRNDLDLLESRLMSYLDRRLAAIEQTQRELLVSLQTSPAAGTAVVMKESPAAPVLEEPLAIAAQTDTVIKKTVPGSAAPAAAAIAPAVVPAPAAAPAPAETAGGPPKAAGTPPPVVTVPTVVEVERAILDTGLLRTVSVMFEFNKATLLPASSGILDVLGSVLTKYPEVRIEVAGYTDSSGPDEYNLHLSQLRAEAVREYLIRTYSIDPGRLTARGYGESQPIADNNTPTGRALNRRVEFVVEKAPSAAETK